MSDKQAISEAELHAWADGRLDEGRRAELEAWFAAQPEEAERAAAYRSFNEMLRGRYDPVLDEPVPPRLERAARGFAVADQQPRRRLRRWNEVAAHLRIESGSRTGPRPHLSGADLEDPGEGVRAGKGSVR